MYDTPEGPSSSKIQQFPSSFPPLAPLCTQNTPPLRVALLPAATVGPPLLVPEPQNAVCLLYACVRCRAGQSGSSSWSAALLRSRELRQPIPSFSNPPYPLFSELEYPPPTSSLVK
jgi:hypothetical protein